MDTKIMELLYKLKALADKGVDGERENASAMLERLCKKHGIDPSTLGDLPAKKRWFEIPTNRQRLFKQIVSSVIGNGWSSWRYHRDKKSIGVVLTDAEFLEIEAKYEFYWKAWERDLETFYSAFIQTNALYAKRSSEPKEAKPLTADERAELARVMAMMAGMDAHKFHKQISNG